MISRLSLFQVSHRTRRCFHSFPTTCHYQRASEKLFADAEREEAEEAQSPKPSISNIPQLQSQDENWTGEESIQDAVLRMLVDKYKPMRLGPIRTADMKLREAPPKVHTDAYVVERPAQGWQELANKPLLPSIEGHKPWLTTYEAPSHASASIKLGNFTPASARTPGVHAVTDERTRKTERELARRKEQAGRLSRARESTLDYRLGLKNSEGQHTARRNPVSMRGWQALIEDKIQKARAAGHFDKIKGRGQPMVRLSDEHNPFIAREEFLMNRIVQRNGAAPPWVEVQIELETAVNSFRDVLRQSWTRRAIRTLTMLQPATMLPSLSLGSVTSLRDREWEERECSYHDTAIAELNSLVRKYNALAPYSVRRPYYSREAELAKAYQDCGDGILREISERREIHGRSGASPPFEVESSVDVDASSSTTNPLRFGDIIRRWFMKLRERFFNVS
ncbi:uncharacterized protein HD556DRAFT_1224609 [Suillus plorans]|uniref:DnaJ homologue subfamily C member 28 conserved domain-containing protein n=1 Tax=Suillus plorans TaxID=116603 RepID=A0A9P7DYY9_9AGAM|nr:uncharacterized protein HD556DRAFT_1224609 [Suillus plorans]KAG1806524.1 hypothetical protein HD556DRAFT_1224609 [Suillus plorans]